MGIIVLRMYLHSFGKETISISETHMSVTIPVPV